MQNIISSFIFLVCACRLSSWNPTTDFHSSSNAEAGLVIANHQCFFFNYFFVEMWLIIFWKALLLNLNPLAEATRLWTKISWYLVEFLITSIFTRVPEPPAIQQPQSLSTAPWYLKVGYQELFLECSPPFVTRHHGGVHDQQNKFNFDFNWLQHFAAYSSDEVS